jgi:hypothetical protein
MAFHDTPCIAAKARRLTGLEDSPLPPVMQIPSQPI